MLGPVGFRTRSTWLSGGLGKVRKPVGKSASGKRQGGKKECLFGGYSFVAPLSRVVIGGYVWLGYCSVPSVGRRNWRERIGVRERPENNLL